MTDNRILLAEITTAHGIKGLVKLRYFGEDAADIAHYNPLFTAETGDKTLILHIKNAIKGGYVAEIEGVTDRNEAETYRGTKLYISKDQLPEAEDGSYYHHDLIGCTTLENGAEIGKVIAVDNFGAGDLVEIKPHSGEAFYLPFKDEFVGEVNLDKKTIDITVPEGLRE